MLIVLLSCSHVMFCCLSFICLCFSLLDVKKAKKSIIIGLSHTIGYTVPHKCLSVLLQKMLSCVNEFCQSLISSNTNSRPWTQRVQNINHVHHEVWLESLLVDLVFRKTYLLF